MVEVRCNGCGAPFTGDVPAAAHCGTCPPWRCEFCGGMDSMAEPCGCWVSLSGMAHADIKALFARDGGFQLTPPVTDRDGDR